MYKCVYICVYGHLKKQRTLGKKHQALAEILQIFPPVSRICSNITVLHCISLHPATESYCPFCYPAYFTLSGVTVTVEIRCDCTASTDSEPRNSTIILIHMCNDSFLEDGRCPHDECPSGWGCPEKQITLEVNENTAAGLSIGRATRWSWWSNVHIQIQYTGR